MSNQDQRITLARELHRLNVYLRHQRAGCINDPEFAQLARLAHFGRDAMSAVDHPLARRNLLHAVDKDGALSGQLVDNIAVMHNFLADIDWSTEGLEGDPNDVDGANHPGAEASRLQQKQRLSVGLSHVLLIG